MVVDMKVAVLVKPNKSSNQVVQSTEGLVVSLRATPEKGKANAALICVLAEHYGVPKSAVAIKSGASSHHKIIEITKHPA
jgi:uncharacterized protein